MRTHKFKVGDRLRRIGSDWCDISIGDEAVVSDTGDKYVTLRGHGSRRYDSDYFEVVDSANTPLPEDPYTASGTPVSSVKPTNPKEVVGSTKLPLHLIPAAALAHTSLAFYEGATKYGSYNWRIAGVRASTYQAAAKRHLDKWFNGDDVDPDTKVHHLANAAACCLILLDAEVQSKLNDDRPPRQDLQGLYDKLAEVQAHLTKMHAHLNPIHHTEKPNAE